MMRADRLPFLIFVFVLIGLLASLSSRTAADPHLWGGTAGSGRTFSTPAT
jgi:hypothetical protein